MLVISFDRAKDHKTFNTAMLRERSIQLAQKIGDQSPLRVPATLASAYGARSGDPAATGAELYLELMKKFDSDDAAWVIKSFQEKRKGKFSKK